MSLAKILLLDIRGNVRSDQQNARDNLDCIDPFLKAKESSRSYQPQHFKIDIPYSRIKTKTERGYFCEISVAPSPGRASDCSNLSLQLFSFRRTTVYI